MRVLRTFAKGAALAVVGLLLALLLGAAMLRLWLESDTGERWLASQLDSLVNESIAGTLETERVDLRGLQSLQLRGLRLRSPAGAPAAEIDTVAARVSVLSLASGDPVVRSLRIDGAALEVVPGPGGKDALTAALAPREVSSGPSTTRLTLERVRVERLRAVVGAPGSAGRLVVEEGALDGSLKLIPEGAELAATAELALSEPVAGKARLEARGSLRNDELVLDPLVAELPGGARLEARTAGGPARLAKPGEGLRVPGLSVDLALPPGALVPYGGPRLAGPVSARLDAAVAADTGTFTLVARPSGPGGELFARGEARLDLSHLEVRLESRGIDPAGVLPGAPTGRLDASVVASGSVRERGGPSLRAALEVGSGTRLAGQAVGPGRARLSVDGSAWSLGSGELALPGAALTAEGRGVGSVPLAGRLELRAENLQKLGALARAFGAGPPEVAGTARLVATASGRGAARRIDVRLSSPAMTVGQERLGDLLARVSARGASWSGRAAAASGRGRFSLAGDARLLGPRALRLSSFEATLPGSRWTLARPATFSWGPTLRIQELELAGPGRVAVELSKGRRGRVDGSLRLTGLDLGALGPLLPSWKPAGVLTASFSLAGTTEAPALRATVESCRTAVRGVNLGDVRANLTLSRRRLRGDALLQPGGSPVRLSLDLQSPRRAPIWRQDAVASASGTAELHVARLELDLLASLGLAPPGTSGAVQADATFEGSLSRPSLRGEVKAEGLVIPGLGMGALPRLASQLTVSGDPSASRLQVAAQLSGLPALEATVRLGAPLSALAVETERARAPVRAQLEAQGALSLEDREIFARRLALHARVEGTLGQPRIHGRGEADALKVRGREIGGVTVSGDFLPDRWRSEAHLALAAGGRLDAAVEFARNGSWAADLVAKRASLDFISVVPGAGAAEGSLIEGELHASGGGGLPSVRGQLRASATWIDIPGYGRLAEPLLAVAAQGQTLRVEPLKLPGLDLLAELDWRSGEWIANADAAFESFPVPSPGLPFGLLTTQVRAELKAARETTGTILVGAGELRVPDPTAETELLPTQLPPEVRVHRPGKAPRAGPSLLERFLAAHPPRVEVRVARDFWLRSPEASGEVTADLTVGSAGGQLALKGEVQAQRGEVKLAGRRFVVERLGLRFVGSPRLNPALDGLFTTDAGDTTIELRLTGTLERPDVAVSSNPPMPTTEIASLLAGGGQGGGAASQGLSGMLLSGAAGVALGQLQSALAGALPIDVFNLQLGARGQAQRLEAGTYVTPDLFLSFVRNFLATEGQNTNEVRAEYRISSSLSVRTYFGDQEAGGASVLWRHRFRSNAQKRQAQTPPPGQAPSAPSGEDGEGGVGGTGGDPRDPGPQPSPSKE